MYVQPEPATNKGAFEAAREWLMINGYKAVIAFDPDIQLFRGEFVGLNGGVNFYARDVNDLRREGGFPFRYF